VGSFARSITRPPGVDVDRIKATFRNGVLEIHLPKTQQAAGKRIEVKAAWGGCQERGSGGRPPLPPPGGVHGGAAIDAEGPRPRPGPLYHFSDTWQLVINTGTTVVTFLMVFPLQRAQNKDALAVHLKLNEIVAALEGASNRLINVEDLTEDEIRLLHQHYRRLVEIARREESLTRSHSIEEAEIRHRIKRRRQAQLAAALGTPSGQGPAPAGAGPAP
jgi:low affinity Fe/Cu permease